MLKHTYYSQTLDLFLLNQGCRNFYYSPAGCGIMLQKWKLSVANLALCLWGFHFEVESDLKLVE